MATTISPELSKKNKYWIEKHRHYELKHFCLQYPTWKKEMLNSYGSNKSSSIVERVPSGNLPRDPVGDHVVSKICYSDKIDLIERVAKEADGYLYNYILKAVTEGHSYVYLKSKYRIPCSRDVYYDRYRKFFWLLNNERN